MSKPAIVLEYRMDTEAKTDVLRASPTESGVGFTVSFDCYDLDMTPADLACAAEFFARLAAESSKEPA